MHASISTAEPGRESSYTVVSYPELNLDRDITQLFDARIGQPVTAEPDNPAARGGTQALYTMSRVEACDCIFALVTETDPRFEPVYAATQPGTASDAYALGHACRATEPKLEMVADDGQPFDVNLRLLYGTPPTERTTLTAVYGGSGTISTVGGSGVSRVSDLQTGSTSRVPSAGPGVVLPGGGRLPPGRRELDTVNSGHRRVDHPLLGGRGGQGAPDADRKVDPAVDVRNRAAGSRRFSFPAYVERQDGPARITSLSVDVSYDDGETWQRADVRRGLDHWTVTVRHPRNGYASLRTRASDVDGNRLEQTIVRVYKIG